MSPSPRKNWWKRLNPFSAFQRKRVDRKQEFAAHPTAASPIVSPTGKRGLSRAQKAAIIAALGAATVGGVGVGIKKYTAHRERQRVERNAAESRATRAELERRLRESPERVRVHELDAALLHELLGKRHAEEWKRTYEDLVRSEWVQPESFKMHAVSLKALVDSAVARGVSIVDLRWYLPAAANLANLRGNDGRVVAEKEAFFNDPLVKANLRSLGNSETANHYRATVDLFSFLSRTHGPEVVRDILGSLGVEFE